MEIRLSIGKNPGLQKSYGREKITLETSSRPDCVKYGEILELTCADRLGQGHGDAFIPLALEKACMLVLKHAFI
jgi:hypothetical protein